MIIGGAGFVGAYLTRHLHDDLKWEVVVTKMPQEQIKANVKVVNLNILESDKVVSLLQEEKPDYIFHLAAQSSVAVSWKNPGLTVDVNIKGAVNVLEAVRIMEKPARVLLIGSGEEYGHILPEESPIKETNHVRPGNIYAATKACQNMLGAIYAEAYQMDVMMVRAFNHIGPNQAPIFVVADFCKQVAEMEAGMREPVMQVGNLSAKRDFTDVRDVVRAYGLLVQYGKAGETYNVGSGQAIAIEQILQMIVSKSALDIQIEIDPEKLRPVDVPIIEANTQKLAQMTGWKREISLEQTIQETLDYWRKEVK